MKLMMTSALVSVLVGAAGCGGSALSGDVQAGAPDDATVSADAIVDGDDVAAEVADEVAPDVLGVEVADDVELDAVADGAADADAETAVNEVDSVEPVDALDDVSPETSLETDAETSPETIDDTVSDALAEAVDTTPGAPVNVITWTLRTGDDGSLDEASGIAYCLSADACVAPDNALNWDDRAPRSVDVWHTPITGLTRDEIDRVEIRYPIADPWSITCVQVAIDGEPLHCVDGEALLGLGGQATPVLIQAIANTCETCWDATLTHGPVVGATSDHTARIWVRTDSTRKVELRVGRDEAAMLAAPAYATGYPRPVDDFAFTFDLSALAAHTTYHYALDVDGRRYPATGSYHFTTAPSAGAPAAFTFAAGSCARADIDKVPTQPAFNGLAANAPDFFLFIGDNVYYDPYANGSPVNVAGARAYLLEGLQRTFSWASAQRNARADFGRDARADFLTHTPTWAVWDDHDFLHNNSYGVTDGVPNPDRVWAREVFKTFWPNNAYGELADGIYHRFAWGDVDVFMVDGRYFKDRNRSTLLGVKQREWLFSGLASSGATFKFVVDGSDWSSESDPDSWGGVPAERNAFFQHIVDARIEGVVLVSGDSHRSELRILPGADGSYPIPQAVSSGLATSIRACPATNEFFEANGLASCFGADTGGRESYVTFAVDTTLADPEVHFAIHDAAGNEVRSMIVKASALTFPTRVAPDVRDADFDGDGYADLAIGVPDEDTNAADDGLVHVLMGSSVHLHSFGNQAWTQSALFGSNESGDRFGAALAFGDLDGDGDDDLVVAAPGETSAGAVGAGRVSVLRGSPNGLQASAEHYEAPAGANLHTGQALAVADFDADGRDDVAVAIPGRGLVQILEGAVGPLVPGPALSQADIDPADDELGDGYGAALATGDFDGDGYADLAIGIPNEGDAAMPGFGRVQVVYGGPHGLDPSNERTVLIPAMAGLVAAANMRFGEVLISGDFDGDGLDDLVVGAPSALAGAGVVARFFGRDFMHGEVLQIGALGAYVAAAGDAFGAAFAARDFDGDGGDDLAIGVPGRDGGRGLVLVRFADGKTATLNQNVTSWTSAQAGDRFGAALAAHDFNGDGYADLAVGSPGDSVGNVPRAGTVEVIPGRPDGFDAPLVVHGLRATQRWHQSLNAMANMGGVEPNDGYGTCLSR